MKTKSQYLQILELTNPDPTEKEIIAQYRKLCKTYHPDNPKTGNHERFLLIEEAKQALISGKYTENQKTSSRQTSNHSDFINAATDKISSFLHTMGDNIKVPKIKNKRKLIYRKIDNKILVFDVSALNTSKSFLIHNNILNFIIE